jgi:hypothetical protein
MQLRASFIWHDEVMQDVVLVKPDSITLGDADKSTFVTPELELPLDFTLFRPGNRGYLLTLGEHMTGTIFIDGAERDVSEFVRRGGEGEVLAGFRATPISSRDWGVVDLDGSGKYKVFFQFVPSEVVPKSPFTDPGLLLPALAFAMLLHVAILFITYQFDYSDSMVWPGSRSLTGEYLVSRLQPAVPEDKPKPEEKLNTAGAKESAPKDGEVKNIKSATENKAGAAGGSGDTERAKDPNAREDEKPAPPRIGLFTDKNRKTLDNVINNNLKIPLGNFTGVRGDTLTKGSIGFGPASEGSGLGDGKNGTGTTRGSTETGVGGGGKAHGDFVSNKGPIDAGETRKPQGNGGAGTAPKEVKISVGEATGDFSGLSKEEIDKVIRLRSGVFRACYQNQLNRTPGLGGKMVVGFTIAADGTVKSVRVDGSSTLRNADVESCIKSNVARLKFPAKGGAIVTYPFIFSQGG